MISDTKYADVEYACGVAESRVIKVEQEVAKHSAEVERLKQRLTKIEPGTKKYLRLQSEYEDALDDQHNLECYLKLVRKERDNIQAELRRIINER